MKRLHHLGSKARAVARLLVSGFDRESIAKELNIGQETVKVHLSKIFEATGEHSCLEAALFLIKSPQALEYIMAPSLDSREDHERALRRWMIDRNARRKLGESKIGDLYT